MTNQPAFATAIIVLSFACTPEAEDASQRKAPVQVEKAVSETLEQEVMAWRQKRVTSLTSDDGWLTLVGLHWLNKGENTVGSAKSSDVLLPEGKTPSRIGSIFLENGIARIEAEKGAGLTRDGQPVTSLPLVSDVAGEPTTLELGSLRFYLITRGDRWGIRVKDRESAARKEFRGLEYFPIDPKWRLEARLERYEPAKKIPITNIVGMTEDMISPGALIFSIDGTTHRLDPVLEEGSEDLFIIFGDKTNGRETYGAGRYLYASPPGPDGKVIVDLNKAYNPPCVFSDFATCPLPPPQNKLPVPVPAGEKVYAAH